MSSLCQEPCRHIFAYLRFVEINQEWMIINAVLVSILARSFGEHNAAVYSGGPACAPVVGPCVCLCVCTVCVWCVCVCACVWPCARPGHRQNVLLRKRPLVPHLVPCKPAQTLYTYIMHIICWVRDGALTIFPPIWDRFYPHHAVWLDDSPPKYGVVDPRVLTA